MDLSELADFADIIDTRTPAEYADDHIPGAVNMPVLSNAERAAVGALWSADALAARRYGARLMAANIAAAFAAPLFARAAAGWSPLVYCSRGGQRSGGLVEMMRRVGWKPQQLRGGYKAYRRAVVTGLDEAAAALRFCVLAGKTGVGKTRLLTALAAAGAQVVDLEGLANHRGSVFGGGGVQPAQRRFESALCAALRGCSAAVPVFVESESAMIGRLRLPAVLLARLRGGRCWHIGAPLAARVRYIRGHYAAFCADADLFARTVAQLLPYAGRARVAHWRALYAARQWDALLADLLVNYYDRHYAKALRKNFGTAGGGKNFGTAGSGKNFGTAGSGEDFGTASGGEDFGTAGGKVLTVDPNDETAIAATAAQILAHTAVTPAVA